VKETEKKFLRKCSIIKKDEYTIQGENDRNENGQATFLHGMYASVKRTGKLLFL